MLNPFLSCFLVYLSLCLCVYIVLIGLFVLICIYLFTYIINIYIHIYIDKLYKNNLLYQLICKAHVIVIVMFWVFQWCTLSEALAQVKILYACPARRGEPFFKAGMGAGLGGPNWNKRRARMTFPNKEIWTYVQPATPRRTLDFPTLSIHLFLSMGQ